MHPVPQAREACSSEFTFRFIMIDKSKAEMAAVRQLGLAEQAKGYLLCYFHFLQDWERFVRSAQSGVPSEHQHRLLVHLSRVAHNEDEEVFKAAVRLRGGAGGGVAGTPCTASS